MRGVITTFCCTLLFAAAAGAQGYPEKPIRLLSVSSGGPNDLVSRLISDGALAGLGQRMIVENRAFAGIEVAAKAPPDGYTIIHYTNVLWLSPLFRAGLPWDPLTDFAPITLTYTQPSIVVVHPSLPVKSIRELIALARAKPGELNYASSSTGATNHVGAELFKSMTGTNIVRVNYRGGSQAATDLVAGHVHVMFGSAGTVAPHMQSGRLRGLAVTSARRTPLAPGMPTVAEEGLPGYEAVQRTGILAPAATPRPVIQRLNLEITRVLQREEIRARLMKAGMEAIPGTPEEFAAIMRADIALTRKIARQTGLKE